MNPRTVLTTLAVTAGLSLLASAQLAEVMICDEVNEQVYRCSDLNGDGDYLDEDETTLLVDFGAIGSINPYSIEARAEGALPTLYVLSDSMPDGVYRGQDVNLDGTVSASELTVYFDLNAIHGAGGDLHGVTLTADGAVWISSSFESTRGLWRLQDANGDGDAMDAGEWAMVVDGSATHPVETDLGVVQVHLEDLRFLARDGNGVIGYSGFSTSSSTSEDCLFRFEDLNLDGDVLDPGESKLLLNYTGKNPALPVNPDFGASLPTLELPNPTTPSQPSYARLWFVETLETGGQTEYFFAPDASASGGFGVSVTGDYINGMIFRGVDLNGDGDVNDAGEVNVYYDGSLDGPLSIQLTTDKIVGIGAEDGWIYMADAGKRISRMQDMNGDGDVHDAGEIQVDLWSFLDWGTNPPITDPLGPFITDIEAGPNGLFPAGSAFWTVTGVGCTQFAPGPPQIGHVGHALLGTSNFSVTVSGTGANLPAVVAWGTSSTDYFGLVLPLDLAPFGYSGCFLYQNLKGQIPTVTDGTGSASQTIPIPNDPTLADVSIHLQWLVLDIFQGGIALSDLGTVILEQ